MAMVMGVAASICGRLRVREVSAVSSGMVERVKVARSMSWYICSAPVKRSSRVAQPGSLPKSMASIAEDIA